MGLFLGCNTESTENAEALQAVVTKPIVGTKRVPSVLELLTAQGAAAVGAEGDKSLTDCEVSRPLRAVAQVIMAKSMQRVPCRNNSMP